MSEINWYAYEVNWFNEFSSEDLGENQDGKGVVCARSYCDAVSLIISTYGEKAINNLHVECLMEGYVYELSDETYEKIKKDRDLNIC